MQFTARFTTDYGSLGVLHERWKYDVKATYLETTYYSVPGGVPYRTTYSLNAYTVEDDRTEAVLSAYKVVGRDKLVGGGVAELVITMQVSTRTFATLWKRRHT
jgi:hypothetical protein